MTIRPALRPRRDRVRAYGTRGQRTRHGPRTKAKRGLPTIANFVGARQLVRQDGGRAANFRARNRCNLPRRAHQLASAYKFRGSITRLLVSLSTPRGDGLPPLHARLASGCWSQLCRAGFQPAGFLRKVSEHSTRPPLPSFLGASFVLALFSHHWLPPFEFTGNCSFAPRRYQRAQVMRKPSPAGYCVPPTAELRKIEWARSGRAEPLSYYAPNRAIPADKSNHSSRLPPTNRWPFSRGMRRSTPAVRGVPA